MPERDGLSPTGKRQFTRRSLLLAGAQTAGLSLIGWRLFGLQVLERGHYAHGDRDHDGVPNRYDRAPDNPYRR